ncbi:hypothetical protein C408_3006 [Vibrio diabolicus E0666]|jgi:hypothetical protein|uniref:Uncharacterized protein n=1 Tax=Vibrio antiquarius (strain Ex25) TaxID=150340 RepID=A0ACA6QJ72_VIBAE|nr:hypothetical protein VEA_002317 [Vibrio antiquarius]EMD78581.1 hypothetical protein C408_3006 [Vibrio diabolicus E0666]
MVRCQSLIGKIIMSTELKFALSIAGGFFTIGVVAIIMVSRYAMMAV